MLLEDRRPQRHRRQAGVVAQRVVGETEHGVGERVAQLGERAEADLLVRRRIHRGAVQQRERHPARAQDRRPTGAIDARSFMPGARG